jgi:hypothetical protein
VDEGKCGYVIGDQKINMELLFDNCENIFSILSQLIEINCICETEL